MDRKTLGAKWLQALAVCLVIGCAVVAFFRIGSADAHVQRLRAEEVAFAELEGHIGSAFNQLWRIRTGTTHPDARDIDRAEVASLDHLRMADAALTRVPEVALTAEERRAIASELNRVRSGVAAFAAQVRRVRAAIASQDRTQLVTEAERGNRMVEELTEVVSRLDAYVDAKADVATLRTVSDIQRSDRVNVMILVSILVASLCLWGLATRNLKTARAMLRERDEALEAAAAASAAKTNFLAVISHEIRTPLNGVLGMASGLNATRLNPEQREMVEVILGSGNLLLNLLNDLLDLSRVEAGKLDLNRAPFDVRDMTGQACVLFAEIAREKGLALNWSVDDAVGRRFEGDATRLRQVLGNLVGNAVKFTQTGGVDVTVTMAGDRLRFSVADTGPGFTEATRQRLFRAFEQADASTTRAFGGSGLGLAISRGLVELMGGSIDCAAEVGHGATFWVEVPLPPAPEAPAPEQPQQADAIDLSGLRVLCAEDNPTNQRVLSVLLQAAGVEAVLVENGQLAAEAFAEREFDLVILDMQMPVLDGLGAARAIRAHEAARGMAPTPLLALSANAMEHHVRGCLDAGMDGHVSKPIQSGALFAAMAETLHRVHRPQGRAAA